jgi:hypothetical protein
VIGGTILLSTLLIASRESAGRIGVQLALRFTPRQIQQRRSDERPCPGRLRRHGDGSVIERKRCAGV